ncbi:MAG TPA: dethiobiotin synthase [Gemmatimonadales bacterium]|jgi:dethiobiotin synthetase|nr:dethiobiotin synthase [Gemmatimonadales bacterium]
MRSLLITGTDAGVGKTRIACALARALTAASVRVVAIKPVETGCAAKTQADEDGARLAAATGQAAPLAALHRLSARLAPALAADSEAVEIDLDALLLRIEELSEGSEVLLLEGAGGLLSPISWEWSVVELARSLGATVLVVGSDRLGVINHALLTLSALELAGVTLTGVVLTAPAAPDRSTGLNAPAIARLAGIDRVIAEPQAADALVSWLDLTPPGGARAG